MRGALLLSLLVATAPGEARAPSTAPVSAEVEHRPEGAPVALPAEPYNWPCAPLLWGDDAIPRPRTTPAPMVRNRSPGTRQRRRRLAERRTGVRR